MSIALYFISIHTVKIGKNDTLSIRSCLLGYAVNSKAILMEVSETKKGAGGGKGNRREGW